LHPMAESEADDGDLEDGSHCECGWRQLGGEELHEKDAGECAGIDVDECHNQEPEAARCWKVEVEIDLTGQQQGAPASPFHGHQEEDGEGRGDGQGQ
jgi:hypothetical protein